MLNKNGTPGNIHITTLGCSKNVYDSEILMGQLKRNRANLVDEPEQADVIIINTCGFIDLAKQESIEAILEAEKIKKEDPRKKVIVCGCLSERYRKELEKEIPTVDAYYGTEDFENILKELNFSPPPSNDILYEERILSTPSHYAYLKISEGCNHTCAFCAIPLMRGKHRSKSIEMLVQEARELSRRGVKELIIISQDTTFYGLDLYGQQRLIDLLKELEAIEGIEWIRLHYLYPTTVQNELFELMAGSSKIVPYLDMPIQHISDRMLKIMKRGGTSRRIREIFELARKLIPDVILRTTLIVGHPGETENDFKVLKDFVGEMEFDRLGVFTYSHEENTAAFHLEDLPEEVKTERYNTIMELQQGISLKRNQSRIGKIMKVIIDEIDWSSLTAFGRTTGDSPEIDNEVVITNLSSALKVGEFVDVRIADATEYELYGEIEV